MDDKQESKFDLDKNNESSTPLNSKEKYLREIVSKGQSYEKYLEALINEKNYIDNIKSQRQLLPDEKRREKDFEIKYNSFFANVGKFIKVGSHGRPKFMINEYVIYHQSEINNNEINQSNKGMPSPINMNHPMSPSNFNKLASEYYAKDKPYKGDVQEILNTFDMKQRMINSEMQQNLQMNRNNNTPQQIDGRKIQQKYNNFVADGISYYPNNPQVKVEKQQPVPKKRGRKSFKDKALEVQHKILIANSGLKYKTNLLESAQERLSKLKISNEPVEQESKFFEPIVEISNCNYKLPEPDDIKPKITIDEFILKYNLNEVFIEKLIDPISIKEFICAELDSIFYETVNFACKLSNSRKGTKKKLKLEDIKIAFERFQ
ncbi:hypothetical protein A0H76_242 [Hepatospora eriocheir]|uniref:Transcription initiation factor TFIID subunit 12 domain-containing protein n=1 Tax=Hepatospora eriocheir TaxID=1081669 RepID=A0A1X0QL66_9MICR|nr:hypothetical protein A0H76_242 [Hepatospora eriocheir]